MKTKTTTLSIALLISGATIGAGILGLPIQTGLAGLIPSVVAIIVLWLFMFTSGSIIADRYLKADDQTADIPSIFHKAFGFPGEYLATIGYLVNYYGIMVAYLAASTACLRYFFQANIPSALYILMFFIPATLIAIYGMKLVLKANLLLMVLMGISFCILLALASKHIVPDRYTFQDWGYLPACLPVILTAFVFHNIIPSICRDLNRDRKAIRKTMFIGTALPCLINILWVAVVCGALPLQGANSIMSASLKNQPATVPLSAYIHSDTMTLATMIFSFTAIFTSYVAVAVGLRNFFRDLLTHRGHQVHAAWPIALAFGPPLTVTLIYPRLFLNALDIAGGVGVVIIFGLLPALMLVKAHKTKLRTAFGIFLIVFFLVIMGMTIAKECGWLKIDPNIQNWKSIHHAEHTVLRNPLSPPRTKTR